MERLGEKEEEQGCKQRGEEGEEEGHEGEGGELVFEEVKLLPIEDPSDEAVGERCDAKVGGGGEEVDDHSTPNRAPEGGKACFFVEGEYEIGSEIDEVDVGKEDKTDKGKEEGCFNTHFLEKLSQGWS